MAETALVESQVSESIKLIQQLDTGPFSPSISIWYFYDDVDDWKLLIAGPAFDDLLPKQEPAAYRAVIDASAVAGLTSLSVSAIKMLRTDARLVSALKTLVGTGPKGITRAHFVDTTLNGIFIKEMVVLRCS